MICAYIFAIVALISLPSAINSHNLTIIIAWISSNFLQLVLLPIIIVGQNIQAAASDKRAEDTYKDAEAVLHEAIEIQKAPPFARRGHHRGGERAERDDAVPRLSGPCHGDTTCWRRRRRHEQPGARA